MANIPSNLVTELRALPEKLRRTPVHLGTHIKLLQDAADEIDRLRGEVLKLESHIVDVYNAQEAAAPVETSARREYHARGVYWSGVPTEDMPCDFCGLGIVAHDPRTHACPPPETEGEWVPLDHDLIANGEPVRMRRKGSPNIPQWEMWRAVKSTGDDRG